MSEQKNWQLPSNFDIMNAEDSSCDCGHAYFETVVALKKVPAAMSPTGESAVVPIPIFKCSSCGKINKDYHKQN